MKNFSPAELRELSIMITEHVENERKRTVGLLKALLEGVSNIFGGR